MPEVWRNVGSHFWVFDLCLLGLEFSMLVWAGLSTCVSLGFSGVGFWYCVSKHWSSCCLGLVFSF